MKERTALNEVLKLVGLENIVEILATRLSWSELQTLLLYVYEERIKKLSIAELIRNHEDSRFSEVSATDPRELLEIDKLLYNSLFPNIQPIELSPVGPAGANAILTALDPKVSLATIRNVEVVSDHGMMLAIECAKRRKKSSTSKNDELEVHLAASHRPLRLQMFQKESGMTAHFRSFAIASAARDTKGFNHFELKSLQEHVSIWLDFLSESDSLGYRADEVWVAISDIRLMEKLLIDGRIDREEVTRRTKDSEFAPFTQYSIDLPREVESAKNIPLAYPELETHINEMRFSEERLVAPLREKYPSVRFFFHLERCSGVGYYSGLCYKLTARTSQGKRVSLAGGGACDWTRKLLQSKRERLVSSAFGSETFLKMFKVT